MIRVGRSYYLVASSFHFSPGLPVLKSEDLVHWKIIANAVRLWGKQNPDFFKGTVVEKQAASVLATQAAPQELARVA